MTSLALESVAKQDKSVVARLLELCAHDLSEYLDTLRVNQHGLFGFPDLDEYWTHDGRFPYFIRSDGNLAGLVLLRSLEDAVEMAEFFVLRNYRRARVGTFAAAAAFKRHPGPWQVEHAARNDPAAAFWQRAIEANATGSIERDALADGRVIYRFATRG